jgi:nucleotide-binding universal stress UspA family protein
MAQVPDSATVNMEGCVMLALSTFRQSEKAIDAAIERSREVKKLAVVYVADVNLARYFVDVDLGLLGDLRETCEEDLLKQHENSGKKYVAAITARAEQEGIAVQAYSEIGRFAVVCLEIVERVKPSLIVTTRSKRPEWVKKFFGAPVDDLMANAGCPVTVV